MAIHSRGYVSIAELVIYIPAAVLAFTLCARHGFTRSSGWIYTLILCIVRIVGSICQLLTYSDHSDGLLKATLIIDSIGISPLLLATLGMLSRFVDWINARGVPSFMFGVKHFRLVQLLITLGLILSIAGGTGGSSSSSGSIEPSSTSKVGIILYIVAFVAIAGILVISSGSRTSVPIQERRIPIAVGLAFPFILIRLAYSALAIFVHDHTFSIIDGSVPVFAGMAVIEEFAVVAIYLFLGFNLKKLQPGQEGEIVSRPWKDRRNKKRGSSHGRERSRNDRSPRRSRSQGRNVPEEYPLPPTHGRPQQTYGETQPTYGRPEQYNSYPANYGA